jgi:putative transposase
MRQMGLMAVYAKPCTSTPHPEHTIYPYLLRNMQITKHNQVRLSNTMNADFCVSALDEAMSRYGVLDIFNTDQGALFFSYGFTRMRP